MVDERTFEHFKTTIYHYEMILQSLVFFVLVTTFFLQEKQDPRHKPFITVHRKYHCRHTNLKSVFDLTSPRRRIYFRGTVDLHDDLLSLFS